MPRISLWKDGKHTNDYRFFDRRISEQFTLGGTGVLVHKYLGPADTGPSEDATRPQYTNASERNIQDLLFLENRDRKYDTSIYNMRGIYQVSDNDFDLTQFGLFLQTGTLFMVFHLNDMIATLGRRIMNGDVLELEHLKDYDALDTNLPAALKRFYVVSDAVRAAEGFSPTWWPHLWRCKINPLVDSQEYKDILKNITVSEEDTTPIRDILSTYDTYINVNQAVVTQAETEVPKSGYDTTPIYHNMPNEQTPDYTTKGWLTGDGLAPNGLPVVAGISFPASPATGDYCLRTDFVPNRLFRYDGRRWLRIEDAVRTNLTNGAANNLTLRNSFVKNNNTYTDSQGDSMPEKQNLNQVFRLKPDN